MCQVTAWSLPESAHTMPWDWKTHSFTPRSFTSCDCIIVSRQDDVHIPCILEVTLNPINQQTGILILK